MSVLDRKVGTIWPDDSLQLWGLIHSGGWPVVLLFRETPAGPILFMPAGEEPREGDVSGMSLRAVLWVASMWADRIREGGHEALVYLDPPPRGCPRCS